MVPHVVAKCHLLFLSIFFPHFANIFYYQGKSKEDVVDTVLFVALIVPVSVFFVMAFIMIAVFMVRYV